MSITLVNTLTNDLASTNSVTLKHDGLRAGVGRFDLLAAFERTAKLSYGLSRTAIALVRYAICKTQDADYVKGAVCGVWSKVSSIADDLLLSSRSINSAERELEAAGFIMRTCGINGARNGRRIDGLVQWAAGINLAPLIDRYDELIEQSKALALKSQAIALCKSEIREISKIIRQSEEEEALEQAQQILPRGRTSRINDLDQLKGIRDSLSSLLEAIIAGSGEQKTSDAPEENLSPNILTKYNYKNSKARQREIYENITPALINHIADPEYRTIMDMYGGMTWNAIIETSYQLLPILKINQSIWGRACQMFGREIAATCIAIIYRNSKRDQNHPCHARSSQACLLGMIKKHNVNSFNLPALLAATESHQSLRKGE